MLAVLSISSRLCSLRGVNRVSKSPCENLRSVFIQSKHQSREDIRDGLLVHRLTSNILINSNDEEEIFL